MPTPLRLSCCVVLLALLAGCATNPVTGRREITLMSEAQEIQLGASSDQAIVAQYGLLDSQELHDYVEEIGERMVPVSHRPHLDFHFRVLDDPIVNAFALPGGYVYITRGILGYLNDEAALAGVVGHEIGHITAKHGVSRYTQQALLGIGLTLGGTFSETIAGLAGTAGQLLLLKYGRDDERQSDRLGVEYATKLGYDTEGMALFFQTLGRLSEGAGRLPSWASTHPDPGERYETVLQLTNQWQGQVANPPYERSRDDFLRRLEGLVFGADPRQGYIEDGEFRHPDMRFRFPVPANWKVQNASTQVTMVHPDGAYGVIFTLDAASSPQEAARNFGRLEGVTVTSQQSMDLNGLNAVRTEATSGSGSQAQSVLSTFIAWNGRVFAFHGIVSPGGLSAARRDLIAPANGFRSLTDPAAINKQPVVLRIVEATTAQSFREAASGYPIPAGAGVDLAGLALLNGMRPESPVSKGQLIKVLRRRSGS